VKLCSKLSFFPEFFVSFVLFLCRDTLCKGLGFFSLPDNKSHKICDKKLAGRQGLANPTFKVSLFLSKISVELLKLKENVEGFQDQSQAISAAFGAGKQLIGSQHMHALKEPHCTLFLVMRTNAR